MLRAGAGWEAVLLPRVTAGAGVVFAAPGAVLAAGLGGDVAALPGSGADAGVRDAAAGGFSGTADDAGPGRLGSFP